MKSSFLEFEILDSTFSIYEPRYHYNRKCQHIGLKQSMKNLEFRFEQFPDKNSSKRSGTSEWSEFIRYNNAVTSGQYSGQQWTVVGPVGTALLYLINSATGEISAVQILDSLCTQKFNNAHIFILIHISNKFWLVFPSINTDQQLS